MRSAWRGAHVRVAYARASLTGGWRGASNNNKEGRAPDDRGERPTSLPHPFVCVHSHPFHNGHPQVSFSHTQATRRKRCRTRATEVRVIRNDRPVGYTHTHDVHVHVPGVCLCGGLGPL